ncbi:MAG: four helix bundle protein [Clostridia bacterium]|nr:four helix bundle protein [Clostridia bacterium]
MKENILLSKTKTFALNIINLCNDIKGTCILTSQLLRSGTSIGANIHEANYAHSKSDFISKMQIALKECYETEYWLDLLMNANIINSKYSHILKDCIEIKKILISTCKTAKDNS